MNEIDAVSLCAFDPGILLHTMSRFIPGIEGPYLLKGTKDLRYLYAHPRYGITFDILPLRASSLKTDLMLRDFTVNTLIGLAHSDQGLVFADPLGVGFRDMFQMRLKTPKDPILTLKDDPVRAIRALRLAHTRGFFLETRLKTTLLPFFGSNLLKGVAIERIRQEIERTVMEPGLEVRGFLKDSLECGLAESLAYRFHIERVTRRMPDEGIEALFQSLPRFPWIRSGAFFLFLFQSLEGACQALMGLGYGKKKVRLTRKVLDKMLKSS